MTQVLLVCETGDQLDSSDDREYGRGPLEPKSEMENTLL